MSHDYINKFSDGIYINSFIRNKEKIIHELVTNSKYQYGYDTAKHGIINYIEMQKNKLSFEEKIEEYIKLLNLGYIPKAIDNKTYFSNGEKINQFWHHKEKIIKALFTNQKYQYGYDTAKEIINNINKKLSKEDKIKEYIELVNNGYIPVNKEQSQCFSDGSLISAFWQNNREIIISELYSNELYNEDYDLARIIIKIKCDDKYKRLANEFIYDMAVDLLQNKDSKKLVKTKDF